MNKFEKIVSDMSPYLSTQCFVKFEDSVRDTYIGIIEPDGFTFLPRPKKTPVPVMVKFKRLIRVHPNPEAGDRYILLDTKRITKGTELQLKFISSEMIAVNGKDMLRLTSYVNGKETVLLSLAPSDTSSVPAEVNIPVRSVRYKT